MQRYNPMKPQATDTTPTAVLELPPLPHPGARTAESASSAVAIAPPSGGASVPASRDSASRPALKKISFGAAAKKKEDTGKDYPVFDDPTTNAQVLDIAARIKQRSGEIEALFAPLPHSTCPHLLCHAPSLCHAR